MPKLKTARIQGSIGTAAFWGCTNLEKVTYVNGKEQWNSLVLQNVKN